MGEWKHILGQRSFTLQWASDRLGLAYSACSHAYRKLHIHACAQTQTEAMTILKRL